MTVPLLIVRNLQDFDYHPSLERHMELFVDHLAQFYNVQYPAQTYTESLVRTFDVVYDHVCRHILLVAGLLLEQFPSIPSRYITGKKSQRFSRVLPPECHEFLFNRV
ncbi:hypothetical protein QTP88_013455 [Uroleucon formosanum]